MSDPVDRSAAPQPDRVLGSASGGDAEAADAEAASKAASLAGAAAASEAAASEAASEAAAEAAWEAAWEAGYKAASEAAAQDEADTVVHKHPFYLRGRRLRLPSSRRGLFALLLVLGGAGFISVFASVSLIHWTETADFCGRCHTMAPELQAYEAGPHKNVACAECHVEPGITGWLKAKINGTKQLIEVVLGSFPTPIPPPEHSNMPVALDTCEECHGVTRDAVKTLKTKTVYTEDEKNTAQFVGLMVRPGGGNPFDVARSVHWHVLRTVDFYSDDPRAQDIDLIEATQQDGTIATYVSLNKVKDTGVVQPDIDAITKSDVKTTMSCYDCHNRVGHDIANPRDGIDNALFTGVVDKTLPYIKRESMRILYGSYDSVEAADAEADRLPDFYAANYPLVASSQAKEIKDAVAEIKVLYRLTATPEMRVSAKTYPNNLGHLDFPGCFRCHDGGHYKVVAGQVTKDVIPSTCDTCHTFPQIGPAVASLPLGEPPPTHTDALWVFNHKSGATSVDPGGQTCGACHARDYCENCHSTGAVTVDHATMATNHAAVIRKQGNEACAYCHQPVFCATCHGKTPVLPVTTPFLQGSTIERLASRDGVSYPLAPTAQVIRALGGGTAGS